MNLNHLKAFIKVVETKSFKDAAKQLSVSQPAITQRIQLLEAHFDTKLLRKDSSGFRLTPQGESVYNASKEILYTWDELENKLFSPAPFGKLLVGASTIPSEYILPGLIKNFRRSFSQVSIRMKIAGSHQVMKWLLSQEIDVAITGALKEHPNIYTIPIVVDKLQIIAPVDCNVSAEQFSDLLDSDWIVRETDSNTRHVFEKALVEKGFTINSLNIAAEMGSTEAVIAAVEENLGIAMISSLASQKAVKYRNVKIIEISDFHITRNFYLSCLKDHLHQPLVSSFITFVKNKMETH